MALFQGAHKTAHVLFPTSHLTKLNCTHVRAGGCAGKLEKAKEKKEKQIVPKMNSAYVWRISHLWSTFDSWTRQGFLT